MIYKKDFYYKPYENELERASNSYLMSLVVIIVGLPLPIINLIASVAFYIANRKSTTFVRWHCLQALLTQLLLFFLNFIAVWWTVFNIYYWKDYNVFYITYISIVVFYNIVEFILTMYTAIGVRKGQHLYWHFFGKICDKYILNSSESNH